MKSLLLILTISIVFVITQKLLPSQVPAKYQPLYNILKNKLDASDSILEVANWTKYPVKYTAELLQANGNRGLDLLNPQVIQSVKKMLDDFHAMGINTIKMSVPYPLFRDDNPRKQDLINFYKSVMTELRKRDFTVVIQTTTVFPDTNFSQYHPDYSGLTIEKYEQDLKEHINIVLSELKPDYLNMLTEPHTQAYNTKLDIANLQNYTDILKFLTDSIQKGNTKIGAGAGSWDNISYFQAAAAIDSLDFIDIHVYPVNGNYLFDKVPQIADVAHQAGKRIAITESWLYKTADSEAINSPAYSPQYFARNEFSFWELLDEQFINIMAETANYINADLVSFFWSPIFYGNLEYSSYIDSLPVPVRTAMLDSVCGKNIQAGNLSSLGIFYQKLINDMTDVNEQPVITNGKLLVYPNPASNDFIKIIIPNNEIMPNEVLSLSIYNSLGETAIIKSNLVTSNDREMQLDVSRLMNGIYTIVLRTISGNISQKFIVIR